MVTQASLRSQSSGISGRSQVREMAQRLAEQERQYKESPEYQTAQSVAQQQEAIRKLEQERTQVDQQLDKLKQDYEKKIEYYNKQGTLTASLMQGINRDYISAKSPLVSQQTGYNKALEVAKQGVSDYGQLKQYAGQVATYQEQSKAVDRRAGEISDRETKSQKELSKLLPQYSPSGAVSAYYDPSKKRYYSAITGKFEYSEAKNDLVKGRLKTNIVSKDIKIPTDVKIKNIQERQIAQEKRKVINQNKLMSNDYKIIVNEKETKKNKEIYSSQLGGYVSASEPSGQATGFIRTPTKEERTKIEQAQYSGTILGISEKAGEVSESFNVWFGGEDYKEKAKESLAKLPKPKQSTEGDWLSPSGVKSLFDWGAEQTLKAGEFAGEKVTPLLIKAGVSEESWLFKPTEKITRKQVKDIISTAYMFSAFEPFMRTGTYQQSQYADEVVEVVYQGKKVKMTSSEAQRRGLTGTRTQAVGEFGRASSSRQVEIIKSAFKDRLYLDEASRFADIQKAISFMKEAGLQNTRIKEILLEVFPKQTTTQTSTVIQAVSEGTAGGGALMSTTRTVTGQAIKGAELKGISLIETGSTLLSPQKVGETNWLSQSSSTNILSEIKPSTQQKQETKQRQINLLKLDTKTKQLQKPKQLTKQTLDFTPITKTTTTTIQPPRTKTDITSDFFRPRPTPRRTTPRKPTQEKTKFTPLPTSNLVQRLAKKAEEGEFEAVILKGGKEISLGIGTKEKVTRKLSKTLIGTLSASGFLKETKTGKKIKAEETGLLGSEFRKSKVSKFLVVEKKGKRLRKGTTGKIIQPFRKTSKKKSKKNLFNI